jgi:GNAT superfamily N-acetyltransferase
MPAQLTFRWAVECEPGTVYSILAQCYADILDTALRDRLSRFDREVFTAPDTVGACAFISWADEQRVGFFSYDPRQGPDVGIIGHNGILPPFRRNGYGAAQIMKILRQVTLRRVARARVSTSEHPFFLPARRMYEKCGFRVSRIAPAAGASPYGIVYYEKSLIV